MIDTLLGTLAPHRCSSCGEIGAILCESCKYDIISDTYSGCLLCTAPCGAKGICKKCARSGHVTQAWCLGERRDGLKKLIDAYKFDSSRAASSVCAELFDRLLPQLPAEVVVVGIPSAPATIRARGFDHMARIVGKFARKRELTTVRPLERLSDVTLHFLSRSERVRLGPSLFRLSATPVPEQVLLLDDIVTTGTTLTAATALLKRAGAKYVYVAALARQPED